MAIPMKVNSRKTPNQGIKEIYLARFFLNLDVVMFENTSSPGNIYILLIKIRYLVKKN